MDINPSFHIDLQHSGISDSEGLIKANFGHGARNWGATEFHEVGQNETFESELKLRTLDQVVGNRRVSLLKVDCEGCEWAALKGGRRALRRVSMIKIEVVQPSYTSGNETVTAETLLLYLENNGFNLYTDLWAENEVMSFVHFCMYYSMFSVFLTPQLLSIMAAVIFWKKRLRSS